LLKNTPFKRLAKLNSTFYPLQPTPSHWFKPSIVHIKLTLLKCQNISLSF